jgi:hypothetical protein
MDQKEIICKYVCACLGNETFMRNVINRYGNHDGVSAASLAHAIHDLEKELKFMLNYEYSNEAK